MSVCMIPTGVTTVDSQLRKRLTHAVDHYAFLQEDGYGDRVYADIPVPRMAYKEAKISIVKTVAGTDAVSTIKLYMDGVFPITGKDKVVLDGATHPVLAYQQFDGLRPGTGTTVVYL